MHASVVSENNNASYFERNLMKLCDAHMKAFNVRLICIVQSVIQ